MNVWCINAGDAPHLWPVVSHYIIRAFARADIGLFRDTEEAVLEGKALLWVIMDGSALKGAVITQIQLTDKRKICTILACGGDDAPSWVHLIEKIEAYARWMECHSMRISGRKGWMKLLKDYRMAHVILEKRL